MRKLFILALLPLSAYAQTLLECQEAAERNYPLIRQYDLIEKTTRLTVANIGRGWLPQVSAAAQATVQSDVTSWPEEIRSLYRQMGLDMKGLSKDQYRVGIDVSQMVYDGGSIRSQQEVERRQGEVEAAQTEVALYQVRRRVNEMYFALLLLDEQIRLNADLQELLSGNEKKLATMFRQGTAAESDYLSMKAERLKVVQQATDLQSQRRMLGMMLGTFCGIEVTSPEKPESPALPLPEGGEVVGRGPSPSLGRAGAGLWDKTSGSLRPEMKAIDARLRLADARERSLNAALRPRVGVFAQGFYGYPGLNMFEDMMQRDWSWNAVVGARLSWNIGALYTRRNDKAKIQLQRDMAETSRDVFLFDNSLEQIQQNENIARYRRLMADDEEIISLHSSVRKAAESKLEHGIIDVNDLLREINAENNAQVQQSIHEIEMLKEIYNLKFTTNN